MAQAAEHCKAGQASLDKFKVEMLGPTEKLETKPAADIPSEEDVKKLKMLSGGSMVRALFPAAVPPQASAGDARRRFEESSKVTADRLRVLPEILDTLERCRRPLDTPLPFDERWLRSPKKVKHYEMVLLSGGDPGWWKHRVFLEVGPPGLQAHVLCVFTPDAAELRALLPSAYRLLDEFFGTVPLTERLRTWQPPAGWQATQNRMRANPKAWSRRILKAAKALEGQDEDEHEDDEDKDKDKDEGEHSATQRGGRAEQAALKKKADDKARTAG